ncbi:MAG: protease HtpX [Bacteriovoracaceae bacterium]
MARRIFFMIATTMVVTIIGSIVISFLMSFFGIEAAAYGQAGFYQFAALISFVWGMGGAFISLLMSKWMAKKFYRLQMLDEHGQGREIVSLVHQLSRKAGLKTMPEVGVYNSSDLNAFATGPSRNNSLVAVSDGLLHSMNRDEVEGVIAHEVAHIANGDMVTMTLVQGIVNSFVLFLSRVVAGLIDNFLRNDDDNGGGLGFFAYMIVYNVLYMLFGVLSAPIVMWFSRFREYRADSGGAYLVGKHKMIAALEKLKTHYDPATKSELPEGAEAMQALQISGKLKWSEVFSTHPPLEKRINALRNSQAY